MAVDIVFSFDTTGSMYPCLDQVKHNLRHIFPVLFADIPDLRIGLIAHGDYCDYESPYHIVTHPLTSQPDELSHFVRHDAKKTYGGDSDECYEEVFHVAAGMNWRPEALKAFVLIADANPHEPSYNVRRHIPSWPTKYARDWRETVEALRGQGVEIVSVKCLRGSDEWYKSIAQTAIRLAQFADVPQVLKALTYHRESEESLVAYEEVLIADGTINRGLADVIDTLLNRKASTAVRIFGTSDLQAVDPSRFQVIPVDGRTDIRGFVERTGAVFQKGRGFYMWTKPVLVQERKEVVLRHKKSGDMFAGSKARDMIGLPYGERGKLRRLPAEVASEYDVFIQSTSYNRVLLPKTMFLYDTT